MDGDTLLVRVRGQKACFTRPEHSTDRVSYEVPTHSAMRGVLEAVYWKPEFFYRVLRADFLGPVFTFSRLQNEVKRTPAVSFSVKDDGISTQRRTTYLVDPDYLLTVQVCLPEKTRDRGWGEVQKHRNILIERLRKGQFHSDMPFLGMREWPASVSLVESREAHPVCRDVNYSEADLGLVQYDRLGYFRGDPFLRRKSQPAYLFSRISVTDGVLRYPLYEDVESQGTLLGGAS